MSLAGFVVAVGASADQTSAADGDVVSLFRAFDREPPVAGLLDAIEYVTCDLCVRPRSNKRSALCTAGELSIIFDGWLENANALATECGCTTDHDAEIVLAAYARWADDTWSRLYGEYSFVLWDASRGALIAVRDKVGVRPIFFATTSAGVVVGNLPGAVAAHPAVAAGVNLGYAAEFLCAEETSVAETLYAGVERLPGGHVLTWRRGRPPAVRRYWQPSAIVHRQDIDEATETCKSLVQQAVGAATRGATFVGCDLSGGIDSSSVAAALARLVCAGDRTADDTMALSLVYPGLPCDESQYISAVADVLPYPSLRLRPRYSMLQECNAATAMLRYPFFPFNASGATPIVEYVRQRGGVLLSGEGGDELFEPTEHALRGAIFAPADWSALRRLLCRRWSERGVSRSLLATLRYAVDPFAGQRLYNTVNRWRHRPRHREGWPIDPEWARSINLRKRLDRLLYPRNARTLAMGYVLSGAWSSSFEWIFMMSCVAGVEARHPLSSARLIEYCNRLPLELLDGQEPHNRRLMRRAGADLLPQIVVERTSKAEFTPATLPALVARAHAQRNQPRPFSDNRARYRYRAAVSGARHIWRLDAALAFELWLQQLPQSSAQTFCCEYE